MLGMIGGFTFEMGKTEFDAISHEIEYNWSESHRIGNHPKLQNVGKSKESISFSGTLLLQKVNSFDDLEAIAEKGKPVTLSFVGGTIQVVIKRIVKNQASFLKSGEFIKQGFSISIQRYYR